MSIIWSPQARGDVDRLVRFVAEYDRTLADDIESELRDSPKRLLYFPRRGSLLSDFGHREVRELRIGKYLLRYELAGADIHVLRFFHAREDRSDEGS